MKPRTNYGSVLIGTLLVVFVAMLISGGMLTLAVNTYKQSKRSEFQARAQAVAESELENLYLKFRMACTTNLPQNASGSMTGIDDIDPVAANPTPTSPQVLFLQVHQTENNGLGWQVQRSIQRDARGSLSVEVPTASGSTTASGTVTYVTARVIVSPPAGSPYGTVAVRLGRRFSMTTSSVFQYSLFYQGTLEMAPGTNTTISGDIAVNGNAYIASTSSGVTTIEDQIRTSGTFNGVSGNILYNPAAPPLSGATLSAPSYRGDSNNRNAHVTTGVATVNFTGGIDPEVTATADPDLFGPRNETDPTAWSTTDANTATNNVYRSVIVPPPADSTANEYPNVTYTGGNTTQADNPTINTTRVYSNADLIITVDSSGSVTNVILNPTFDPDTGAASGTNIKSSFTSGSNPAITSSSLYDEREGQVVKTTEVNVEEMKNVIDAADTSNEFNGVIYVNVTGSTSSTPQAVKLTHAEVLPESNSEGQGVTIATNGGLYVQGDYNTGDASHDPVPSALYADAVTALSEGWKNDPDSNPTTPLVSTDLSERTVASGTTMTINAGIVTGSTPSDGSNYSGGANNLVRYLENWQGSTVNFNGSLGRLFDSVQFNGAFQQPGTTYRPPARNFTYDPTLARNPPPGSTQTLVPSRGELFVWYPGRYNGY